MDCMVKYGSVISVIERAAGSGSAGLPIVEHTGKLPAHGCRGWR